MIGYNIMVLVEILTRCSYETLTAKFVQVVKIHLFTVVSNFYAKITFLPKQPLLTYVHTRRRFAVTNESVHYHLRSGESPSKGESCHGCVEQVSLHNNMVAHLSIYGCSPHIWLLHLAMVAPPSNMVAPPNNMVAPPNNMVAHPS